MILSSGVFVVTLGGKRTIVSGSDPNTAFTGLGWGRLARGIRVLTTRGVKSFTIHYEVLIIIYFQSHDIGHAQERRRGISACRGQL